MDYFTKEHKLETILKIVDEYKITAYEISNNCNLTEAGISRILKGIAKNPHEVSLNEILNYLENRITGTAMNNFENVVNDPMDKYLTLNKPTTELEKALMENVQILTNNIKLLVENQKLKNILEKNNIKY